MKENVFATIPEAVADIKRGKFVVVIDDEDRENEGDLVLAAEKITPEKVNFMAKYGRGLICTPLEGRRLDELEIPDMVCDNTSMHQTAFSVSVDAKHGATTGISAQDRSKTIKDLVNRKTKPEDLVRPGHIFPLRAKEGGVLKRAGQTEASIDLAKLAKLYPAGVICEIMKEDGKMARLPDLIPYSKKHGLKIITVASIIQYRRKTEKFIKRAVETTLPNQYGVWKVVAYENLADNDFPLALILGDISKKESVLVRMHSECLT
ncbi:MAG: 3,4-dihydroxy-2-butanone-4-phosphate synthase, partial [Candidatus Firestonebacteria bacterium]